MPSHALRLRPLDPSRLAQHTDALYRAAWALCGSAHDAEDLVQDTFVNVLARPRRIRGNELGYLLRALRNAHTDRHRAAARRPVTVELIDHHAVRVPEVDVSARGVLQAIAGAPPHFRDAVIAVDLLGLTYAEASRHLGAPEDTIASRLYRGRAHAARRLMREGHLPPPKRRPRPSKPRGSVTLAW